MGQYVIDRFSALHLLSGLLVGLTRLMGFWAWFILHGLFEVWENSPKGVASLTHVRVWPGGKDRPDRLVNSVADQFWSLVGFLLGQRLVQ